MTAAARPPCLSPSEKKYDDRLAVQMLLLTTQSYDDKISNFYHELDGLPNGNSKRILLQQERDLAVRVMVMASLKKLMRGYATWTPHKAFLVGSSTQHKKHWNSLTIVSSVCKRSTIKLCQPRSEA
jgi:hypothetical protein